MEIKFSNTNIICGVYTITSPIGKVYVGASSNIYMRHNNYKNLRCKQQPLLYESIVKYGFDSHLFEVYLVCQKEFLHYYERLVGDYYKSVGENGLNCYLPYIQGMGSSISLESRNKISLGGTGRKHTDESKLKMSISRKGKKIHPSTIQKISEAKKGKYKGVNNPLYGRHLSAEQKEKIGERHRGANNHKSKKVIDTNTGQIYVSITDCAKSLGVSVFTLHDYLTGRRTNKFPHIKIIT